MKKGTRILGTKLGTQGSFYILSKANFSFQFMTTYVWYSMEKLAGDLLLGLKLVKLSILPMLFIQFV